MAAATVITLVAMIPLTAFLIIPYIVIWEWENFYSGLNRFMEWSSLIPVLLIGIPVHELIHGLSWIIFGKVSHKDIRFGIRSLTPFAHCQVPVRANVYRISAFMPAFLLGIFPYIFGFIIGNGWLTIFGLVYILAAGGDLLVLWILRGVNGEALVEDHPSRAGCYVIEE